MPYSTPSGGAKYATPHTQAPQAPIYRSPPRRQSLMACSSRIRIHRPRPSPNRCRPLIPYRETPPMITSTDLFAAASPQPPPPPPLQEPNMYTATPTISFQNPGLIPLECITTFGLSAKDTANPIGQFGTGLKYAISIILRNA